MDYISTFLFTLSTVSINNFCELIDKDVNESRNARVSKKILVLENLISQEARNSRKHKAKLCYQRLPSTGRMGGRALGHSREWLVEAGSGPVISKPSATNKPNGPSRPPSTEVGVW